MRCRRACARCAASRRRRFRAPRFRSATASAACSRRAGRLFLRTKTRNDWFEHGTRSVIAGLDPAIHHLMKMDGCEGQAPALRVVFASAAETTGQGRAMATKSLQDKVVIVTGAGRGIGREIALLCAAEGAKVVVNDPGGAAEGWGRRD